MGELHQQKQQANILRKNGELKEALVLYKELSESNLKDKFDVAGYLHCLRKLKLYDEAIKVATKNEETFGDFNWFRIEAIWTYISEIKRVEAKGNIENVISFASKIMNLKPDEVQKNIAVLSVLKKAKQVKRWDIATLWIDRVTPETLDTTPMVVGGKLTVWNDYVIWQKHKVTCLNYQKRYQEAIEQIDSVRSQTSKVRKYFLVLEVDALMGLKKEDEALNILKGLTKSPKADWWIVHRFANALNDVGEKEHSLNEMYRAANLSYKVENSINLLKSIFLLTKELNKVEEAYYHLLLFKLIREKMGWPVHEETDKQLNFIGKNLNKRPIQKYQEVLRKCKTYWNQTSNTTSDNSIKELKRNLNGSLMQVRKDRSFCFIQTSQDSFFCHISEIKGMAVEGMTVKFDAVPTYDQKKQQESWKAVNVIRLLREG